MKDKPRILRKGGYSGDQQWIVRFRSSTSLHETLKRLAEQEGLCLAALVRRLVVAGLEKTGAQRP
jgi:hypothetical protein